MNIKMNQIQFIKEGLWCSPSTALSTFLFLPIIFSYFCSEFVIRIKTKSFPLLRRNLKQYSYFHNNPRINTYWINSNLKNFACTYWVSGFSLELQEQNHVRVLWLGSVGCLFLLHLYRTANGTLPYKYN